MATKKELEKMREHARLLFMQGEPQKVIAEEVGVSAQTITKWVNDGGWQAARSAANITRPELVNKILKSIDVLVEDLVNEPSPEKTAAAADKLVKFSAISYALLILSVVIPSQSKDLSVFGRIVRFIGKVFITFFSLPFIS